MPALGQLERRDKEAQRWHFPTTLWSYVTRDESLALCQIETDVIAVIANATSGRRVDLEFERERCPMYEKAATKKKLGIIV